MPLKFCVIGQTGQLARALQREIPAANHSAIFLDRSKLDLSKLDQEISQVLSQLPDDIDGIILAAAYTAVDKAETEKDLALQVNGIAPGIVAKFCKTRDIPLVHISTDYVFNGTSDVPYKPSDDTDPINNYGASKRAGEIAIQKSGCKSAVLRTSWVFDGIGANFMNTMLRLAETREALSVVADQIGRPTYAGHLAQAAIVAAERLSSMQDRECGIYHVSGSGEPTSWAGFAVAIFAEAKTLMKHEVTVTPIPSTEFPTPAPRPAYSVLDLASFEEHFNYYLPSWVDGLRLALVEKSTH